MYNILVRIVGRFAPIVTLPVAVVLGIIGYTLESKFSSKSTGYQKSVNEERMERLLSESSGSSSEISQKDHGKYNKTMFERNDASDLK
jgi:hypothetical protein